MTFQETMRMITSACDRCFLAGAEGCREAIIQCATQIYIAQMEKDKEREE